MLSRPHPIPLTDEQVLELIKKFQEDQDAAAQEMLVERYREMVEMLAYKFARGPEPLEDLVQVGMIGLLGSLSRYDPSFERSFEGFAVPTIVGEIKRHIRDKTWSVHVPRRIKELGPRIKSAVEELTTQLQRSPRVEEIADYLGVTNEDVLETMEMGRSYQATSLDSPIESTQDGNQVILLDLVGTEDSGYSEIERKMLLEKVWVVLTEQERNIIQLIFFQNFSQKQAGEHLGISQMHISRIQRRALDKLRHAIRLEATEVL